MSTDTTSIEAAGMRFEGMQLVVLVGAALAIVGAFLTWVSIGSGGLETAGGSASASGIAMFGDVSPIFNGVVTAVLAVVCAALAATGFERENAQTAAVVLGVLVTVLAGVYVVAPNIPLGGGPGAQLVGALLQPGLGLWLTVLGGVGMAGGGLAAYYG